MLQDWSKINKAVRILLDEINVVNQHKDEELASIDILVDLSTMESSTKGIYMMYWDTTINESIVNSYFKQNKIKAIDHTHGEIDVIGLRTVETNKYQIYFKRKEDLV